MHDTGLDLGLAFVAGVFGSAHCVGMCGGFALALAHRSGDAPWVRQSLYHAGRVATYAGLGVLAGMLGYGLFLARNVQLGLSIGLGVVLVVLGLSLCGLGRRFAPLDRLPIPAGLSRAVGRLLGRPSPGAALGLGMLNGLLPCGLVFALLVQAAASGDPLRGGLTMLAFGAGTLPALLLTVAFGRWWSPARRLRLQRWAGVFVMLLGLLTIVRATPLGATHLPHALHAAPPAGAGLEGADALCRVPR